MTASQEEQVSVGPTKTSSLSADDYTPVVRELAYRERGRARSELTSTALARVDAFVHENPFGAAAIVASVGVLLGLALSSIFSSSLPGDSTTHAPAPGQPRPPPQRRRQGKR